LEGEEIRKRQKEKKKQGLEELRESWYGAHKEMVISNNFLVISKKEGGR